MKTITIRDVAEFAKVSTMTVSNVINNELRVLPETRERVLQSIENLGYVPNKAAQNLKKISGNKDFSKLNKYSYGIILEGGFSKYNHPFQAEILEEIEKESKNKKIDILFIHTEKDLEDPILFNQLINPANVSGLILVGATKLYKKIKERINNIITLEYFYDDESDSIVADLFGAGYVATKYLISLGHNKIGIIGGNFFGEHPGNRNLGYSKALKENNIEFNKNFIEEGVYGMNEGYNLMHKLLDRNTGVTAVFAVADLTAIGAIKAIKERGLKIPEDISIIGCDDLEIGSFLDPPLTTMRVDRKTMGRLGLSIFIERINNPEQKGVKVVIPSEIVIRRSCQGIS